MTEKYSPSPEETGLQFRRYTDEPKIQELLLAIESETVKTTDTEGQMIEKPSKVGTLALEIIESMQKEKEELLEENAFFRKLAGTDELTQVLNRRAFNGLAPKLMEKINETKIDSVLFLIDLDHFKKVNDTYGHDTGDTVLKFFAQAMENTFREEDLYARLGNEEGNGDEGIIARLGGEEFTALLVGMKGEDAVSAAKRLDFVFKKLIENSELPEQLRNEGVKISIGAAVINEDDFENGLPNVGKVIKRADENLYKVKNSSRNGIIVEDQELQKLRE